MNNEELLAHLTNFLCEIGQWTKFEDYLKSKGYDQDDIDDL